MNTIFQNIDELRDYITVDVSSTLETVKPYIVQAERYVREITGDELFEKVVDYVNTTTETDEALEKLLPKLRYPLANFGYMLAVDKLNVNVGNTGISVTVQNNLEPASQWRVEQFRKSLEESGNTGLEMLIAFLEAHKNDYPEWVSSDAYSFSKRYFVNNAGEFRDVTEKKISRLEFLQLREYIRIAEEEAEGIVCSALMQELKQQYKDDDVSELNRALIERIKPLICYRALALKEENELYKGQADKYAEGLRLFINKNAESYPLYLESECYSTSGDDIDYSDSCVYGFGI